MYDWLAVVVPHVLLVHISTCVQSHTSTQFQAWHPAVPHFWNNPIWCTGLHCGRSRNPSLWASAIHGLLIFFSFGISNVGRPTGTQWRCYKWFIQVVWFIPCREAAFFTDIWLFCTSASARCIQSLSNPYCLAPCCLLCSLGILAGLSDTKRKNKNVCKMFTYWNSSPQTAIKCKIWIRLE